MERIFKYTLSDEETQEVRLPKSAKILTIKNQNEKPCLWAIVEENDAKFKSVQLYALYTGALTPPNVTAKTHKFIETLLFDGGTLVVHYFVRSND